MLGPTAKERSRRLHREVECHGAGVGSAAGIERFRIHSEPSPMGFRSIRVHDLKHTFGRRLRAAGKVQRSAGLEACKIASRRTVSTFLMRAQVISVEQLLDRANRFAKIKDGVCCRHRLRARGSKAHPAADDHRPPGRHFPIRRAAALGTADAKAILGVVEHGRRHQVIV
jgi:hypothetical protein